MYADRFFIYRCRGVVVFLNMQHVSDIAQGRRYFRVFVTVQTTHHRQRLPPQRFSFLQGSGIREYEGKIVDCFSEVGVHFAKLVGILLGVFIIITTKVASTPGRAL